MNEKAKKTYLPPALVSVTFKLERGYAASGSGPLASIFGLGNTYTSSSDDPWSGSSSGSGNHFGGWTDNGESAWF